MSKLRTLLTNPFGVARKYLWDLPKRELFRWRYRIRGEPYPIYTEDYNEHWNYLNFRNKVVLDLGADHGSTAVYFHKLGAKKIIAIEGDHKLAKELYEFAKKVDYIIPVECFITSEATVRLAILAHKPDIVKCDIEGYERILLDVPSDVISKVPEWLIESHSDELTKQLCEKFKGYRQTCFYWGEMPENIELHKDRLSVLVFRK